MVRSSNDMSPNALAIHRQGVWPLVTGAEMQALDRSTIETRGIASEILMESAGRALVRPALELRALSTRTEAPIRVFCGAGNNGGDGFVLVRHLWAEGIEAEAILVAEEVECRFLLIDERKGRAVAKRRGITVVGVAGVLLAAKKRGLIDAVLPILKNLERAGYRVSAELIQEIARLAGEDSAVLFVT